MVLSFRGLVDDAARQDFYLTTACQKGRAVAAPEDFDVLIAQATGRQVNGTCAGLHDRRWRFSGDG